MTKITRPASAATESEESRQIERLRDAVLVMDCMSQEGFSAIYNLADMGLKLMEDPATYCYPETIATLLRTISVRANDIENAINSEAEEVGCNYKDDAADRRYSAFRAAEALRMQGTAK